MQKKTLIVAQVFISMLMAILMSGIMGLFALGPTEAWLHAWPRAFIIAWPIAFCLSFPVARVAFGLATRLTVRRPAAN